MTVSTLAPRARRQMQPPAPPDPVTAYALDVIGRPDRRRRAGAQGMRAAPGRPRHRPRARACASMSRPRSGRSTSSRCCATTRASGRASPIVLEAVGAVRGRLRLRLEAGRWHPPLPPGLPRGRQEERQDADRRRDRAAPRVLRRRAGRRGLCDRHQARPGEARLERRQAPGAEQRRAGPADRLVRALAGRRGDRLVLPATGPGLGRGRAGHQRPRRHRRRAPRHRRSGLDRQHRDLDVRPAPADAAGRSPPPASGASRSGGRSAATRSRSSRAEPQTTRCWSSSTRSTRATTRSTRPCGRKPNPNLGVSVCVDFLREQAAKAKRSPGKLAAFLQLPDERADPAVPSRRSTWTSGTHATAGSSIRRRATSRATSSSWSASSRLAAPASAGLDLASVQDLTADHRCVPRRRGLRQRRVPLLLPRGGHRPAARRTTACPTATGVRDGYLIATPGQRHRLRLRARGSQGDRRAGPDRGDRLRPLERHPARRRSCRRTAQRASPSRRRMPVSARAGASSRELVLEGKLRHGGHPVLRWMAENVEVETDAAGQPEAVQVARAPSGSTASSRWTWRSPG